MIRLILTVIGVLFSKLVYAESDQGLTDITSAFDVSLTEPVKYFILITAISFLPAFIIGATAFTRIIVVLSMLRLALGLQSTPPNIVLITLAFFLTIFSMSPVFSEIDNMAVQPYVKSEISIEEAAQKGSVPLKEFMLANTEERDLLAVIEMAGKDKPTSLSKISLFHLVPAFMLSELRTAFKMGFVLFLPFILIDILVASILMGLGMIMVPPMTVSLPIKILVFILSDGWLLLSQSLLLSFK